MIPLSRLLGSFLLFLCVMAMAWGSPSTFCNPLCIPDYPVGRAAREVVNGDPIDKSLIWLLDHKEQFRELADPSVIVDGGKWYLYPSCDMAWVSEDHGGTWTHRQIQVEGLNPSGVFPYRDLGYAPSIVKHGGKFLLIASDSQVYAADTPLGIFKALGFIRIPRELHAPCQTDPMLFSDDDGRLFFYWGCTQNGGIWAVELDPKDPTKLLSVPKEVFRFEPKLHPWESLGEWNQNTTSSWMEGSWMLKHKGTYYLTYSAAGTMNKTYAMGCYVSKSPLGPFTPQKRNPILRTTEGLVTGTGHGCFFEDEDHSIWVFYTIRAGVAHGFERRIGMDRAEIDAQGNLFVPEATSLPQWLEGRKPKDSPTGYWTGWLPLNSGIQTLGSSTAPNLPGRLAVDNDPRTWWQPGEGDREPTLTTSFSATATIHAVRVIWRDIGLNTKHGVLPGPFRYRVDAETEPGKWTTLLDRTASGDDLLVDYRECAPVVAKRARLMITGYPQGITPGVAEFTLFGETLPEKK
jgi:hypothetical protein